MVTLNRAGISIGRARPDETGGVKLSDRVIVGEA
jgi:hypothetical protein